MTPIILKCPTVLNTSVSLDRYLALHEIFLWNYIIKLHTVELLREPSREKEKPQLTEPTQPFSDWFRASRPPLTFGWGRSGPEMARSWLRGPFSLVFSFRFPFLSHFGTKIGRLRAATTTSIFYYLPLHFLFIRFDLIWGRFAGVFGWLEPPTNSLAFLGKYWPFQWMARSSPAVDVWWASDLGISSSSSFYQLPYSWGRLFKTLFEEPLPHPNRMANSIWPLVVLLGWDEGSKPYAVLDISCCGCSCKLLEFGQDLCRFLVVVIVVFCCCCYGSCCCLFSFLALCLCPQCRVFCHDVCHFLFPLCRALYPSV